MAVEGGHFAVDTGGCGDGEDYAVGARMQGFYIKRYVDIAFPAFRIQ
jgi:hypothetical protein